MSYVSTPTCEECDLLRSRLAAAERERDEARAEAQDLRDSVIRLSKPDDGLRWWARADAAEADAARLREALRGVQYREPNMLRVPECIGCGAVGPINEKHRKREPEPCAPECPIRAALAGEGEP